MTFFQLVSKKCWFVSNFFSIDTLGAWSHTPLGDLFVFVEETKVDVDGDSWTIRESCFFGAVVHTICLRG